MKEALGLLFLRLSIGGLMLFHGVDKVFNGIGPIKGILLGRGWPEVFAYGVYLGEFLAPILILIGLKVRVSGLLVAFTMLVAIFLSNTPFFSLTKHGGLASELALLYLLGGVCLFCLGGGKLFSVDQALLKKSKKIF